MRTQDEIITAEHTRLYSAPELRVVDAEPWEMTLSEYRNLCGGTEDEHRESVLDAYKANKPVDPETIEMYRDGGWIE